MSFKEKISSFWKGDKNPEKKAKKQKKNDSSDQQTSDGLDAEYLFDFTKSYDNSSGGLRGKGSSSSGVSYRVTAPTHNIISAGTGTSGNMAETSIYYVGSFDSVESPPKPDKKTDGAPPQKIKAKPIDVLNEIEVIPTPFSLVGIDQKIAILNDKREFIKNKYAKREVEGVIERLENRKQYAKHVAFFTQFQNTTDEKIEALLTKYDLEMKSPDLFVPEFPDQAVSIMKKYTETCKKICDKKPVFYVIAEPGDFKEKDKKRDPILLAQSPFGFYWQILGAWDKEMIMLGEL